MKLLKTNEVAEKLNVSRDHFRKRIKHQPDFPKPYKSSENSHPMWIEEIIDSYLIQKAA